MSFLLSTSPGMKTGIYPNLGREIFDPTTLFVGDFLRRRHEKNPIQQLPIPNIQTIQQRYLTTKLGHFNAQTLIRTVNNKHTPRKINGWKPENTGPLEKENLLPNHHVQVLFAHLRGCRCFTPEWRDFHGDLGKI